GAQARAVRRALRRLGFGKGGARQRELALREAAEPRLVGAHAVRAAGALSGRARRPDHDLGGTAVAAGFVVRFREAHVSLLRRTDETSDNQSLIRAPPAPVPLAASVSAGGLHSGHAQSPALGAARHGRTLGS